MISLLWNTKYPEKAPPIVFIVVTLVYMTLTVCFVPIAIFMWLIGYKNCKYCHKPVAFWSEGWDNNYDSRWHIACKDESHRAHKEWEDAHNKAVDSRIKGDSLLASTRKRPNSRGSVIRYTK